jgi:yjeF C-terminal region, hydroxyethylthiazole kinase-related
MTLQRLTSLPTPPSRPSQSNKGTFGRVLIVAGSTGMSGAAALSGLGALRGGAGLVYVATPRSVAHIVAAIDPSYLTIPLSVDDAGVLDDPALGEVWGAVDGKNVCAIGPGLGQSRVARELVTTLYQQAEIPLVVDADALNLLSQTPEILSEHAGPRILTPHPGEFGRLTGKTIDEIQHNREGISVEFSRKHGVVLVLKGEGTVVTDGQQLYVNTTGNSGMSTGGTGDVLTGLIAALIAQKMSPFSAAQLGVFLHGRAGDLAAAEYSQPGMIASDLARFLGAAWKSFPDTPSN